MPLEAAITLFFEQYAALFNAAIAGAADIEAISRMYASELIGASPAGVATAKNDDQLETVMTHGYARYRAMGMKQTSVQSLSVIPLDERHCVAKVAWQSTFQPEGKPEIAVDFVNHYLIQSLDGTPKVFGWITGDEQALLKQHGLV
jgi:hypothetical protein